MGETPENSIQADADRSVSRRRALQAGAALGVGAAAWTGPKIGAFGTVPAYAQNCSTGETPLTAVATDVSLAQPISGEYTWSTAPDFSGGAFSVIVPATGTLGTTSLTAGSNGDPARTCVLTVVVTKNGGQTQSGSRTVSGAGALSITTPAVAGLGGNTWTGAFTIRCAEDSDCL